MMCRSHDVFTIIYLHDHLCYQYGFNMLIDGFFSLFSIFFLIVIILVKKKQTLFFGKYSLYKIQITKL